VRDLEGAPHLLDSGFGHAGHELTGVGIADLDHAIGVDLGAGDSHRFALGAFDDAGSGVHGLPLADVSRQSVPLIAKSKT
jgi:hypothetical protein